MYTARGQVLESERQLRGLLGLRSDDGARLVPIDEPNQAPYRPDFHEAANDAIAYRPELLLARQDVKFRQLDLLLQRNLRRPDLRGFAQYDVAGLGTQLDGRAQNFNANGQVTPGNAFSSLVDNRFNSWTLGMRLDIPIGFRDANGLVRQATLNMQRSYIQLRDSELKAIEYLTLQYRRVVETHTLIAPRRAERESLQRYLYRIRTVINIGRFDPQSFLNYLTVQQQLATAIAAESRAVSDYNIALAQLEFAKGTSQPYNNVSVGEGPLPPWVSKRAADHIRERTEAAIKLREQPMPAGGPAAGGHPVSQLGSTSSLLRLPPFAEKREPLPDMTMPEPPAGGNPLPAPRPAPDAAPMPMPGDTGAAPPRPMPGLTGAGDFQPESRVSLPPLPAGQTATLPTAPPITAPAVVAPAVPEPARRTARTTSSATTGASPSRRRRSGPPTRCGRPARRCRPRPAPRCRRCRPSRPRSRRCPAVSDREWPSKDRLATKKHKGHKRETRPRAEFCLNSLGSPRFMGKSDFDFPKAVQHTKAEILEAEHPVSPPQDGPQPVVEAFRSTIAAAAVEVIGDLVHPVRERLAKRLQGTQAQFRHVAHPLFQPLTALGRCDNRGVLKDRSESFTLLPQLPQLGELLTQFRE